jgi:hypothetical protein
MLEANTILSAFRRGDERDDASKKLIASGLAGLLKGGQEAIERGNRRALFEGDKWENPEAVNDPDYNAAVETFVNTGDLSALNAYKMRKMQEREQKMREDELSTRKTLAEIENRRGKEEANKIRESQIDDVKTALRKAIVQAESENVTPDIRMNGEIDIEANRKKLSDLGNPVSDEELEKLREKYREKNVKGKSIKTGAEGEVVGSEEVEEDGDLYGSIRAEADIEARKRKLKEITAEYKKNGVTDEQKAELVDVVKRIANETPASKRDDEFLTIMSNIDKLQTKEDVVRYEKGLAKKYHEMLGKPARLDRWMREKNDEFEKAKKAHSKYYGK